MGVSFKVRPLRLPAGVPRPRPDLPLPLLPFSWLLVRDDAVVAMVDIVRQVGALWSLGSVRLGRLSDDSGVRT